MAFGVDDALMIAGASALGKGIFDSVFARGNAAWQNNATRDLMVESPALQMRGFQEAGLNPMLAVQRMQFPTASAQLSYPGVSDPFSTASAARASNASADFMGAQTISEGFRAKVLQNDAIKGNYAVQQLAGMLDAAMKITRSANSAEAFAALAEPQVRAGLEELRAAFASAKNDADVYEALNSRAVRIALDVLGRLTGTGSAISGAVDRYRARSQRGSIIDLNKE